MSTSPDELPLRSGRTSTGAVTALVPLRGPGTGKTRLSAALSVTERAALAGAMLADVATALQDAGIGEVVVAADGAAAVTAASALGLPTVTDPPGTRSLDGALAAAAARLAPVRALLIVAADLPHLAADDVEALVEVDAEVVVAPTCDGGTGGLLRRPGDACATAYGAKSAAQHLALGHAAGRRTASRWLPGFAHDVDVVADLAALREDGRPPVGARTAAVLQQLAVEAAG